MNRILLDVEFVIEVCCNEECGMTWAVPTEFHKSRRNDHRDFYCPNGHGQHYPQKSKEEILRENLSCCRIDRNEWRNEAKALERSRRSLKGHVTRLKNAMREEESDEDTSTY